MAFSDDEIEDSQEGPCEPEAAAAAPGNVRRAAGQPGNRVNPLSFQSRPAASAAPAAAAQKSKKSRVRWTEEEVDNLRHGVARHEGLPNMWAMILSKYEFNACRSSVDLKDKWRNMNK